MTASFSKKQKSSEIAKFQHFSCVCAASYEKNIHLTLTPDRFACILENYKKYLKSRGLWGKFFQQYRDMINRNINYPTESVTHVKLMKTKYDEINGFCKQNTCFKLHVTTSNVNDVYHYVDLHCCSEFVTFVNLHVYNDDLQKELKHATEVCNALMTCNY